MNTLANAISQLHKEPERLAGFQRSLAKDFIIDTLAKANVVTVRHRKLPVDMVVWLLVAWGLFRKQSLQLVAHTMHLVADGVPAASSLCESRQRVSADAIKVLCEALCQLWIKQTAERRWRGLQVLGIDGTTMDVADSRKNAQFFGRPKGRSEQREAAFPKLRKVGLMELSSKLLLTAVISPISQGEHTSALALLPSIPDDSITIFDRGFHSAAFFQRLAEGGTNRHFLGRLKDNVKPKLVKSLKDGSHIATICSSGSTSAEDEIQVRVITYHVKGFQSTYRVITSLLNPQTHKAEELAKLYHVRWEYELGLRDLKTMLLTPKEPLRSKKPDLIQQELWAILLAYNLVRREMAVVAKQHGVSPTKISFNAAVNLIHGLLYTWTHPIAPTSKIKMAIEDMRVALWAMRLKDRRVNRACPRVIKKHAHTKYPLRPATRLSNGTMA